MIAIAATVVVGFALMAWTQRGMATAPPDNAAGVTELTIDNFVFGPSTLQVASGPTVTWTNRDDVPHTVVSNDKTTFKSKALD